MLISTDSWAADDEQNIRFYTALVERYGLDVRSLNWGSRTSQELRFAVLARGGNLHGASLLDVGCGVGDLQAWLREQNIDVTYTGLDITPAMIDRARRRFPEGQFLVGSLVDPPDELAAQYDVVFASGIFYFRKHDCRAYMHDTVARMFSRCRYFAAFNSLSAWSNEQDPVEYYADPLETLNVCRALTPWVTLRHDYHSGDFSIFLYRERQLL